MVAFVFLYLPYFMEPNSLPIHPPYRKCDFISTMAEYR